MKSTISATYFDGISSKPYLVELSISAKFIEIYFLNDEKQNILWDINQVHNLEELNFNTYKLRYGNIPHQSIELSAENYKLLSIQNRNIAATTKHSWYETMLKRKSLILGLFVGFIALCTFIYFVLIPAVTPTLIQYIPRETEAKLGEMVYKNMVETKNIDVQKTKLINDFWREMGYATNYPIKITVVNDEIVNAFALPGGRIIVYDSLMKLFDNYSQLAALLSHEFIHVKHKHSMSQMIAAYSRTAVIYLLLGNVSDGINAVAQNANILNTLTYSRKLEQEADVEGMKLMQQENISTSGMYQLFEKLDSLQNEDMPEILNYASSHPALKKRIAYCKKFDKANKNLNASKQIQLEYIFKKLKE